MQVHSVAARRLQAGVSRIALVVAGLSMIAATAQAQEGLSVLRVEEDWELVIGIPDEDGDSPQITTAMSPADGDEGDYCSFELNHQSQPSFYPGGLHLHAWDGEFLLGSAHSQAGATLHRVQESVRWTQAMSLSNGQLVYEVTQGTSETWGAFGGETFRVVVNSGLANLNGYAPETSIANSGVGYGANRVSTLTLRTVRLTLSTGDVVTVEVNQSALPTVE